MLRSADRWLATGLIFSGPAACLTVEGRRDKLSRNDGECQSTVRKIAEERKSQIPAWLFTPLCLPSCTRSVRTGFLIKTL